MNKYVYASGNKYPSGIDEEKERDAMWLEDRGLDRSRQRVYDFNGELKNAFYSSTVESPKIEGKGYPTFVVYPDYVEVETVPVGGDHKEEDKIRQAWRNLTLLCERYEVSVPGSCGNKTMDLLMGGVADMDSLTLSTALAHAACGVYMYPSAVPVLLEMGADPNAVVFVSDYGYTTPLLQAMSGIARSLRVHGGLERGADGNMYFSHTACGSPLDIMLQAGGNPFKAVLAPHLTVLRYNTLNSSYSTDCRMLSILDRLCDLACNSCPSNAQSHMADLQCSRGLYAVSSLIDKIAGRDSRFLEFMHCGAFSGGLAMDRIPRYHPGELGTRLFAGGDAMMTSYASMLGLVPRTADIYGPGCYGEIPNPGEIKKSYDSDTEYADKAVALFNAGLPFEWDGRWGMDIAAPCCMGYQCSSREFGGEHEDSGGLGSSVKWLAGRSHAYSTWLQPNTLDTVVAFGSNVDGCRTRNEGHTTVSESKHDTTFLDGAVSNNDWHVQYNGGSKTVMNTASRLLDMGADPNVKSGANGDTPLISLAREFANRWSTYDTRDAMLATLRELLGYGVDVNITNDLGTDALRMLVSQSKNSLWGDLYGEKGRAQQLIEFAQELILAGADLNRTFDFTGRDGKEYKGVPHEHGLDHPLAQFISVARARLNGIDADIQANREKLEAKAAADSKP